MLIHCTIDELLAIRDGEGYQAAIRHLDECEECTHELELLHQRVAGLKALAPINAPRDRWSVVRDEVLVGRSRNRRRIVSWLSVAAAASVVFTLGVGGLMTPAARGPDPLAVLVEEAESLEAALRSMTPRLRVVNGRTAGAIAVLEDRLAELDERFLIVRQAQTPRDELILMWEQRVNLMDALINFRTAPVRYRRF